MSDYYGETVDLEVARYGLRTFRPVPCGQRDWDVDWGSWGLTIGDDVRLGPVSVLSGQHWTDGTCTAECHRGGHGVSPALAHVNGSWQVSGWIMGWGMIKIAGGLPDPPPHPSPHESCGCGIYACHTLDHLMSQYGEFATRVVTVIAAEGQTLVGDKGFRTEYARVVAYWCVSDEYLELASQQFKDAQHYDSLDEMQRAFGLQGETPKQVITFDERAAPSTLGWSVTAQKQQTESKQSLLKKLASRKKPGN